MFQEEETDVLRVERVASVIGGVQVVCDDCVETVRQAVEELEVLISGFEGYPDRDRRIREMLEWNEKHLVFRKLRELESVLGRLNTEVANLQDDTFVALEDLFLHAIRNGEED